jgi:osmotically-inducible protein OsmY
MNEIKKTKNIFIMVPLVEEIRKQDVVNQLTWDDSVNANEIDVEVFDGTVQLKGSVPNYIAKLAAERVAIQVGGVEKVENFLSVEFPPTITLPSDSQIAENIKSMLNCDSRLNASGIDVDISKGSVTLSGSVPSFTEKHLAEKIAITATGVVDVKNGLKVELFRSFIDAEIEKDIKNTFEQNILIDHQTLDVSVSDGVVRLSGTAANYPVKIEAFEVAMITPGVMDVIDEITIAKLV